MKMEVGKGRLDYMAQGVWEQGLTAESMIKSTLASYLTIWVL